MTIPKKTSTAMATVLNQRGFITHDDFSIGADDDFGRYVCSQELTLRGDGYRGGKLKSWNTGFRLSTAFAYGVVDSRRGLTNQYLDSYALATGLQLEQSGLKVADLQGLLIGLEFPCDCGHVEKLAPNAIALAQQNLPINQISCVCGKCKKINEPWGTYPLF